MPGVAVSSLALRLDINPEYSNILEAGWRLALLQHDQKTKYFPAGDLFGENFIVVAGAAAAAVFDLFMAKLLWPLAEGVATSKFLTPAMMA